MKLETVRNSSIQQEIIPGEIDAGYLELYIPTWYRVYTYTLATLEDSFYFSPLFSFSFLFHPLPIYIYIPVPFSINRRKVLSEDPLNDFRMIRPDKSFICSLLSGNDYYEAARGEGGGIGLREDRFGSTSFPIRRVFCENTWNTWRNILTLSLYTFYTLEKM